MADQVYLAVDLGASGGRVVAGLFDGTRLRLEEVHRFENGPVHVGPRTYWDLLAAVDPGAARAARGRQPVSASIASVGVDTWGVDFGLLGRGDELLGNPRHYRDHHTDGMLEQALRDRAAEEIFAATGLQFMQFNTLYQLLALRLANSPLLDVAERFLMIPDLFHWLLTGVKANEFTNATTTQFFNPAASAWASAAARAVRASDADVGRRHSARHEARSAARRTSPAKPALQRVQVVAPGTHDTASAVLAVPGRVPANPTGATSAPAPGR